MAGSCRTYCIHNSSTFGLLLYLPFYYFFSPPQRFFLRCHLNVKLSHVGTSLHDGPSREKRKKKKKSWLHCLAMWCRFLSMLWKIMHQVAYRCAVALERWGWLWGRSALIDLCYANGRSDCASPADGIFRPILKRCTQAALTDVDACEPRLSLYLCCSYRTLRPASSDVFYTRTYSTTKKWDGVSFDKTPMTTHTQRVPSFHSNISKYLFKFSICVVTQTQTNKWENVSVGKKVKRRLLRESRDGWRFLPRRFWVISRKDKEDNVRRWLAGWNSTISVDEKMLPAQS